MRISDWSSDVCSSDLTEHGDAALLETIAVSMADRIEFQEQGHARRSAGSYRQDWRRTGAAAAFPRLGPRGAAARRTQCEGRGPDAVERRQGGAGSHARQQIGRAHV